MNNQSTSLTDIDKPHYNYWQAIVLSFYSSRLYVDVGKRWRKLGAGYLLLVIALASIPFALRIMYDFRVFFTNQLIIPLEKMPLLTIQNGIVSYDGTMPYFGKNQQGQVITIVDTTGQITENATAKYPQLRVLITKNQFIYWSPPPTFFFSHDPQNTHTSPVVQTLDKNMNDVFDGSKWIRSSGINKVYFLSMFIIYPSVLLIFYVFYQIFILVFAMMAQLLVSLFLKFTVTYPQACRLLTVSATPQIFVLLVFMSLDWVFPGAGFILLLLLALYFTYAAVSLKRASNKMVLR